MTITEDVWLPSDEELGQKAIPLTTNYFLASAMWLGKFCDTKCKDFMLCRTEEGDPRRCLKENKAVTECGMEFFKRVKKTCASELDWYKTCLELYGKQPDYNRCRDAQAIFDGCMHDHGFERAKFGHFQMLRVHDPERPKPKKNVPLFPDAVESFDIFDPKHQEKKPRMPVGSWREI